MNADYIDAVASRSGPYASDSDYANQTSDALYNLDRSYNNQATMDAVRGVGQREQTLRAVQYGLARNDLNSNLQRYRQQHMIGAAPLGHEMSGPWQVGQKIGIYASGFGDGTTSQPQQNNPDFLAPQRGSRYAENRYGPNQNQYTQPQQQPFYMADALAVRTPLMQEGARQKEQSQAQADSLKRYLTPAGWTDHEPYQGYGQTLNLNWAVEQNKRAAQTALENEIDSQLARGTIYGGGDGVPKYAIQRQIDAMNRSRYSRYRGF